MGRSNQQLARLIQQFVRGVQTGKIKLRWVIGLVVLAIGYFLLQPVLERSLGLDLPGFNDLANDYRTAEPVSNDSNPRETRPQVSRSAKPGKDELERIFRSGNRDVYLSPGGLRYTRGSQHGHRLKHLMAHAQDEPGRPGQHGVFDSDDPIEVVALVDEAYLQAQTGRDTRTQREEERTVYDVNLRRRVGYIGGESGNRRNRPAANHIRLVVEGDRLITAFPVRP